jgi:prepilin peptidase CpaA
LCTVLGASIALFTDLRTRVIPNWLTLPLLVLGLLAHGVGHGPSGSLSAALGAVCCLLPSYFLFARGALGGGDVKLFSAFGALLGARDGLELELTSFALLALFALASSAWQGRLAALLRASLLAFLHLVYPARFARPPSSEGGAELPMGGAIFVAVLALGLRSWP